MRFYDFPTEKRKEYIRRIQRVKEAHPDTHFPSQAARELLCVAMGLRYYEAAINMAAELGDTKLCEEIYKENQVYKKVRDVINVKHFSEKDTPLMNAVQRKRLGTAEWLLQHGAKILPNKKGWNPVLVACAEGCIPALNMFKYHGVDFNQPVTTWEWWGMKGKRCRYLLPKKVQTYPIMLALRQPKALQFLIDNGASIDVKYETGKSVRDLLKKKDVLKSESRKILEKKAAQTPAPVPVAKKTFWQRLAFGRTKE